MFGVPTTGSTKRKPGTVTTGTTATWQTYLPTLVCRAFFGPLLQPVDQAETLQEMGIKGNVTQLRRVDADWPYVTVNNQSVPYTTDDWPVKPGDQLVLPTGTYSVKGVKVYPPDGRTAGKLELYVEVTA